MHLDLIINIQEIQGITQGWNQHHPDSRKFCKKTTWFFKQANVRKREREVEPIRRLKRLDKQLQYMKVFLSWFKQTKCIKLKYIVTYKIITREIWILTGNLIIGLLFFFYIFVIGIFGYFFLKRMLHIFPLPKKYKYSK